MTIKRFCMKFRILPRSFKETQCFGSIVKREEKCKLFYCDSSLELHFSMESSPFILIVVSSVSDPEPAFLVHAELDADPDPNPDEDPGFRSKIKKNLQLKNNFFLNQKLPFTYPSASIKDVHATEKAISP
jgi:hypothetical protein